MGADRQRFCSEASRSLRACRGRGRRPDGGWNVDLPEGLYNTIEGLPPPRRGYVYYVDPDGVTKLFDRNDLDDTDVIYDDVNGPVPPPRGLFVVDEGGVVYDLPYEILQLIRNYIGNGNDNNLDY